MLRSRPKLVTRLRQKSKKAGKHAPRHLSSRNVGIYVFGGVFVLISILTTVHILNSWKRFSSFSSLADLDMVDHHPSLGSDRAITDALLDSAVHAPVPAEEALAAPEKELPPVPGTENDSPGGNPEPAGAGESGGMSLTQFAPPKQASGSSLFSSLLSSSKRVDPGEPTARVRIVSEFVNDGGTLKPVTVELAGEALEAADGKADKSRIARKRVAPTGNFEYTVSKRFYERYCTDLSAWEEAHYLKSFDYECVAYGDESNPIQNSMKDLVTSWHKAERAVQYRDKPAFYWDPATGGISNPMHLLHNNLFPLVFYHLTCRTGEEDEYMLLPYPRDTGEWMSVFFRGVMTTLFGADKIREILGNPVMWCFPKVTYMRGQYKQVGPGPYLGMECPLNVEGDVALQEECHNLARTAVRFLSSVMKQTLGTSLPPMEDVKRPVNIYVYDRMEQHSRKWSNANDTIALLKDLKDVNIKYIASFKDATLAEQCRFFWEADIFLMPHGGALANGLCSRPHAAVIEIMKKCYTLEEWWFHAIVDTLELSHVVARCYRKEKNSEYAMVPEQVMHEAVFHLLPDVRRAMKLKT